MATDEVFDVTIIGAGPTGLFAAFCAGMRDMTVKIIDRLPQPGGQLAVLYPDKYIYDAPGHSKVLARNLVEELYKQSRTFAEPAFCFNEQVERLAAQDGRFLLATNKGEHLSRTVVIAAGIGAFSPKKLNVAGSEEGKKGIHYFVQDLDYFRNRRVLIVGGGDSAVDWALGTVDKARSVTLVHRRDRFRAHEGSVRDLFESNVNVKPFYELRAVSGEHKVEAATIFSNQTGAEEELPLDDIIFALGFEADLGGIRGWGVEMDAGQKHLSVNPRMETNVDGVYAAGDVTEFTYLEKQELATPQQFVGGSELSVPSHKFEEQKERWGLIVTGYAQAAVAINHAKRFISPEAKLAPGHSSEMAPAVRTQTSS